jgi:hypothetical protein
MTVWDPVSKQPVFKTAACRVSRLGPPPAMPAAGPTSTGTGADGGGS